jgi:hypothetical protein
VTDPLGIIVLSSASLFAVAIAAAALLKGWQGWLDVRRFEIAGTSSRGPVRGALPGRMELVDLKERVRRLEAIANGTEV